jgi:hypothetical protein
MKSTNSIGHHLGVLLGEAEIKKCNCFSKALDVVNSKECRTSKRIKLNKVKKEYRQILKY